jgi:hypothetical protein
MRGAVAMVIPFWLPLDALLPLKVIPLTLQPNGVGLEITKRALSPAQATVVLDAPAPASATSELTVTGEDHEKLPDGIKIVAPAGAAVIADCTSD